MTESANWPAGLRILVRTLPPAERTLGCGIFDSGAAAGCSDRAGSDICTARRLRMEVSFFLSGLARLSLGSDLAVRYTQSGTLLSVDWRRGQKAEKPKDCSVFIADFVRSRQFWWVLVVSVTVNPCFYFTVNWLPTYFAQARHVVPGAQLGEMLTVIFLALDIGNIGGGACTLWLARRKYSVETARRIVFLSATGLVGVCAAVPFVPTLWGAVAALMAVNLGLGIWNSMYSDPGSGSL